MIHDKKWAFQEAVAKWKKLAKQKKQKFSRSSLSPKANKITKEDEELDQLIRVWHLDVDELRREVYKKK